LRPRPRHWAMPASRSVASCELDASRRGEPSAGHYESVKQTSAPCLHGLMAIPAATITTTRWHTLVTVRSVCDATLQLAMELQRGGPMAPGQRVGLLLALLSSTACGGGTMGVPASDDAAREDTPKTAAVPKSDDRPKRDAGNSPAPPTPVTAACTALPPPSSIAPMPSGDAPSASGDSSDLVIDLTACEAKRYFAYLPLGSAWVRVAPSDGICRLWLGGETENPMYDGAPSQYCEYSRDCPSVRIQTAEGGPPHLDSAACTP